MPPNTPGVVPPQRRAINGDDRPKAGAAASPGVPDVPRAVGGDFNAFSPREPSNRSAADSGETGDGPPLAAKTLLHAPAASPPFPPVGGPRCRVCGCSDPAACRGSDGLPCAWIEPDLCTACAGTTATALVARVQRAVLMARCAQVGAGPELPGEAPAGFALAVRWADGSASSAGACADAAALHRDAAANAARGEPPGLDDLMARARRSGP